MWHESIFVIVFSISILHGTVLGAPDSLGIFGGQDAAVGQFPHQVSIQLCDWFMCEHFCGGSLISPNWILTAGHCHSYGLKFKVVAGILNLTDNSENRQTLDVIKTIVHEDYRGNANPNDIALIQVNGTFTFNERVQTINLPDAYSEITGEGVVSGWGTDRGNFFPHAPDTLQYEEASILDNQKCMELLDEKFHGARNPFNVSTNVCTYDFKPNYGICSGDSGGPLALDGKIIGVASWGIMPCGQEGAPSVFTKVSNYIDWIKKHMENGTQINS